MNVEERDGEVLKINSRGRVVDFLYAAAGGLAWGVVAAVISLHYGSVEKNVAPVMSAYAVCAFGLAVNAAMLIRQFYGKQVTFDRRTRTVEISRLFGRKTVMSFESVARVAPLKFKTTFLTREAYCLVPAIAPLFGAKIISPIFVPGGRGTEEFRSKTVPKIEAMLGLEKTSFRKQGEPASHRFYTKDGARLSKTYARWRGPVSVFLTAVSILLVSGIAFAVKSGNFILIAAFASLAAVVLPPLLLLLFVPVKAISLDPQRKTIEVKRGVWGWGGTKAYKFSSVKSFEVRGFGGSGETGGVRRLYLKLDDGRRLIPVIPSAPRGKDVADELKFLASLLDLDPVHDITYTLYQMTNSMFEVP